MTRGNDMPSLKVWEVRNSTLWSASANLPPHEGSTLTQIYRHGLQYELIHDNLPLVHIAGFHLQWTLSY